MLQIARIKMCNFEASYNGANLQQTGEIYNEVYLC
jgi:hypothetical protein